MTGESSDLRGKELLFGIQSPRGERQKLREFVRALNAAMREQRGGIRGLHATLASLFPSTGTT
jgi:hypothetical protein